MPFTAQCMVHAYMGLVHRSAARPRARLTQVLALRVILRDNERAKLSALRDYRLQRPALRPANLAAAAKLRVLHVLQFTKDLNSHPPTRQSANR